jgi:hypothetical protein
MPIAEWRLENQTKRRKSMSKKESAYSISALQDILVDQLKPHPMAEMPIEDDDSAAMENSIIANGVFLPLLVLSKKVDGFHLIIDGINRWKKAKIAGAQKVPCLMAECDDPRKVVLECLATGRKRTTGQRILAFIELHKEEVHATHEENGGREKHLKYSSKVSNETYDANPIPDFTAQAIAARLQCSKEDVLAGIELSLAADGVDVGLGVRSRKVTSEEILARTAEQKARVFMGQSCIRKWKTAVAGSLATKKRNADDKRAPIDYADTSLRGLAALKNAFNKDHWVLIKAKDKERIGEQFARMLKVAPPEIEVMLK